MARASLKAARGADWRSRTTLEGSDDLRDQLRALDRELAGVALLVAVDRGAQVTQEAMEQLAPRDKGVLASNIGREVKRLSSRRAQVAVGLEPKAWHGRFQELGTSRHPAQPFIRPGFDSTKDRVVTVVGEELGRVVDHVARTGGR